MKIDLYRRPQSPGRYAYLAVPEGRPIPNEATNVDWETAGNNIDLDDSNESIDGLSARDALSQIDDKGYAITPLQAASRRMN